MNLERALRVGDRLGGHIVQGHVDGVATRRGRRSSAATRGSSTLLCRRARRAYGAARSVTVDGVSLTVNDLPAPGVLQLSLIEYTLRHTTLGRLARRRRVHVEADMLGKYVAAVCSRNHDMVFGTVEQAIADIAAGKFVIVADDEDRENEGDLICAAQLVTPEMINFMIKKAGGMICLALTGERVDQLGLAADEPRRTSTSIAPRTR